MKRGETGVGPNSKDAIRHRARRLVEKKMGQKLPTSVQVNHKKPLKDSVQDANEMSNLETQEASKNMSNGGKSGSKAGKAKGGRKGSKAKKHLPVRRPD